MVKLGDKVELKIYNHVFVGKVVKNNYYFLILISIDGYTNKGLCFNQLSYKIIRREIVKFYAQNNLYAVGTFPEAPKRLFEKMIKHFSINIVINIKGQEYI